ncbi:MAG: hypothetical protein HETSPECPRED_009655, partial [Heterodermia speciosa]
NSNSYRSKMSSRGFWAWVPDFMSSKPVSALTDDRPSQINISHAQGKTDSYRPKYHDDLIRNGVLPPPRGSGSRIFRSTRRTSPNKGRATQVNSSNRVSKPTSKKTSPAGSTQRTRPSSRPRTERPGTRARYSASREPNGQFAKVRGEKPVSVKLSSPPPNAPKAPLADRLHEMDSLFSDLDVASTVMPAHHASLNHPISSPPLNAPKAPLADRLHDMDSMFSSMDVANTLLPAHRAPFKHYISSTPCTHHLCTVGHQHQEGLYLHEGKLAEQPHNYFGANNPPPWLWEVYKRVEASEASELDFVNLQYFIACHPPCFELCKEEIWE